MRTVDYIVCDDNILFLENIKKTIEEYNFKHNINAYIQTFHNYGKEFHQASRRNSLHKVYILDIETPNKSGLDVAREIRKFDYQSIIIFISTHSDMARNISMDVLNVLTFIPKFDDFENHLLLALLKAQEIIHNKTKFSFKIKDMTYFIHCDDILYITYDSNARKSTIFTNDNSYETSLSLKQCYEKLNHNFRYSHRSCIVNENRIKACTKKKIIFDNDLEIGLISSMFFN